MVSPGKPCASPLAKPVSTLRGVGPERAAQLGRLKILTLEDLLLHRPRRYEDRRQFRPIASLQLDEPATTRGTVVALGVKRFRRGQKSVFELILDDGAARLHCRWWNLPFMENYFEVGDEVVVFGKLLSLKPRTLDHPETEVVENGEEIPRSKRKYNPVKIRKNKIAVRSNTLMHKRECHPAQIAFPIFQGESVQQLRSGIAICR